jgi:hypothetical protein
MLLCQHHRAKTTGIDNGLGAKRSEDNTPSIALAFRCGPFRICRRINDVFGALCLCADYQVGLGP